MLRFFTQKTQTFATEKNINKLSNERKKSIPHKRSWIYKRTEIFLSIKPAQQAKKAANLNKVKQNYLSHKPSSNWCGPRQ